MCVLQHSQDTALGDDDLAALRVVFPDWTLDVHNAEVLAPCEARAQRVLRKDIRDVSDEWPDICGVSTDQVVRGHSHKELLELRTPLTDRLH